MGIRLAARARMLRMQTGVAGSPFSAMAPAAIGAGLVVGGYKLTKKMTHDAGLDTGIVGASAMGLMSMTSIDPMGAYRPNGQMGGIAAMGALGAAGGMMAYFGTRSALSGIQGSGGAIFDVASMKRPGPKAGLFSRGFSAVNRAGARTVNAASRFFGHRSAAFGGSFAIGAAAAIGVVNNSVERLATRVLQHGSSYKPLVKSTTPGARSRRAAPTPTRIMRRAGDYSGIGMTGDTVLALHKTGGRGGVMR